MTTTPSTSALLELVRLNRRFGVMLAGGVSTPDALRAMAAEASPGYREVVTRVLASVEAGQPFTAPLEGFPGLIPAIYREWVVFGEQTGTLDVGAQEVAELLEPLAKGGGDAELGWERIEGAVSLIQFTRRCAELMEKGLEWWRVLYLLTVEAPPSFAEAIGKLPPRRDDPHGWQTMWQRMENHPHTFSPFYSAMVRLGWESRAMDEIMRNLADLLYEDWRLARLNRCYATRASLIIAHDAPPSAEWASLTAPQQKLAVTLFCRAAAMLLSAGHDSADALAVCALLLPADRQEALQSQLHSENPIDALRAVECFPPFVLALLTAGDSRGRLDYAFSQAATVLHAEME